jgi:protocatechuate 4,5-dioxygenase alpha chain
MTARNWREDMPTQDAYWIGKVLHVIHHQPQELVRFKADKDAYLATIPLSAALRDAIRDDDIATLYRAGVNPYILRAHSLGMGIPEPVYLGALRGAEEKTNG